MEKTPEQLAAEEAAALEALEALKAKKEAGEELTPEEQATMQAAQAAEETAALKARKEAGEELTPEELAKLEAKPAAETDELVITLGEEALPTDDEAAKAPAWVRELRQQHKDQARRLRELEEENQKLKAPPKQELKAKPTLESCGFDEDKFERELTAWHEAKRRQEEEQTRQQAAVEAERKAWQATLDAYEASKKELKLADLDDAEDAAKAKLSVTQQGVILHGSAKPALLLYVLGKNSKELDRLAAISDPVKFAFAVAQLEVQVKVTTKKTPPPPEKMPPAGGKTAGAGLDNTLEKLREEAHRTGNYTKLHQYKAAQREKAAGKQ